MTRKIFEYFSLVMLFGFSTAASAATIYFADDAGNVGLYDDVAHTTTAVGNLDQFTISQNIGIAWDDQNGRILLLDRGAPAVYEMDAATGNAALLFTPGVTFQGGALKGNTLYGINESTQRVVAYDMTTFNPVTMSGDALPGHTHAVGIIQDTGQLIIFANGSGIYSIGDDGSVGAQLVSNSNTQEDIDGYGSNYLAVDYGRNVTVIDGTSGVETELVSADQTASAGVDGSMSGVVLGSPVSAQPQSPVEPVPTMSTWALLMLVLLMGAVVLVRRKGSI